MHNTIAAEAKPATAPLPSEQMIRLTSGHVIAQALYVVAELGVPDFLANRPHTSTELADVTGVHATSLYRVLRTLASHGVFVEEANQTFRLTPLGATLRSDVPGSVRAWARVNCGISWRPYGEMLYSVQTGQPGFDRASDLFHVFVAAYTMTFEIDEEPVFTGMIGEPLLERHSQQLVPQAHRFVRENAGIHDGRAADDGTKFHPGKDVTLDVDTRRDFDQFEPVRRQFEHAALRHVEHGLAT